MTNATTNRSRPLAGTRVGILVADGVEQIEVTAPRDALRDGGAQVDVMSPDGRPVTGYHYLEPRDRIDVDAPIGATEIDALVLPGGLGGPDTLRGNDAAVELVSSVVAAERPIGVICHGPWLLLEAQALRGRTLTCVPALRTDVTNGGATYVDEDVHVDRSHRPLLVSGRNFEAAEHFAAVLAEELANEQAGLAR